MKLSIPKRKERFTKLLSKLLAIYDSELRAIAEFITQQKSCDLSQGRIKLSFTESDLHGESNFTVMNASTVVPGYCYQSAAIVSNERIGYMKIHGTDQDDL